MHAYTLKSFNRYSSYSCSRPFCLLLQVLLPLTWARRASASLGSRQGADQYLGPSPLGIKNTVLAQHATLSVVHMLCVPGTVALRLTEHARHSGTVWYL